jgi:hypothetical protein
MTHIKQLIAIVAALAGGGSVVRADQIFTDQAAFLANVKPGFYLETFDALPQGVGIDSPLAPFSKNGFSYIASTEGFNDGFFNVGPPGDTWISTNNPVDTIVFTFTSGNVTAVGGLFFETDVFGDLTGGPIHVTLDNGTTITVTDTKANSFVGFTTSSPILSLTVESGAPPPMITEWPTANDLIVGAAIPEPSALLLAALGLGCVFVGRVWRSGARLGV